MLEKTQIFKNRPAILAGALWLVAVISGVTLNDQQAHAQMINEPWSFAQQNRASIAALMKQTEDGNDAAAGAVSSGGYDQLICGGDGTASATGNSTCIIMNNSDGAVQIGQEAQGNQSATNNAETAESEALSDALGDIENTLQ